MFVILIFFKTIYCIKHYFKFIVKFLYAKFGYLNPNQSNLPDEYYRIGHNNPTI